MTSPPNRQEQVVSAAQFRLEVPPNPPIALSEISGINSRVGSTEYIFNDPKTGESFHTKQFGKTEPPTVIVKRGLDHSGNNVLLTWHAAARAGRRDGVLDVSLVIAPVGGGKDSEIVYLLEKAWIQELNISAMKAGDGQISYIEAKITCEKILSGDVQLR